MLRADGRLEVNGVAVDEPYVAPGAEPSDLTFDVTVPAGPLLGHGRQPRRLRRLARHLGDPGGGMVPGEDIIGKVWVRYWPLGRLGPVDQGKLCAPVPRNGE